MKIGGTTESIETQDEGDQTAESIMRETDDMITRTGEKKLESKKRETKRYQSNQQMKRRKTMRSRKRSKER